MGCTACEDLLLCSVAASSWITLHRGGAGSMEWRWRVIALATAGCASPVPQGGQPTATAPSIPSPLPSQEVSVPFVVTLLSLPWVKRGAHRQHPHPYSIPHPQEHPLARQHMQELPHHPPRGAPQPFCCACPLLMGHVARAHPGCFECKLDITARAAENNICTVNRQTVILINR